MSKIFKTIIALLLLSSCSGGGSSGTGGYSVKGKIIDDKGTPIKGATVMILDQNQNPMGSTTSNTQGIYQFDGIDFEVGTIFCDIPDSEFDEEIFFDFPEEEFILEIITIEQDDGDFDSNLDFDDDIIIIEEEFIEEDEEFIEEEEEFIEEDEFLDEDEFDE